MRAIEFSGELNDFLRRYSYQPELTHRLDNIFHIEMNEELVNEIVLWKLDRYVYLRSELFSKLNNLSNLGIGQHRQGEDVIQLLLEVRGIDLPLASTLLRFRNPTAFQIIDRHAYRALYGEKYRLWRTTPSTKKILEYFRYLDDLIDLCQERNLDFRTIDRLLYVFDKERNGPLRRESKRGEASLT